MSKRSFSSYIINKSALKRIAFIYLPLFAAFWLTLCVAGEITEKAPEPLTLAQDFRNKIPIVYNDRYNIEFLGLEKYHPFDSVRYRRVFQALELPRNRILHAGMPDAATLLLAQTPEYLDSLKSSWTLARITELGFLRFFPSKLSRNTVLEPMMYQTGGSLLAALAALDRGWAINLGGGFHHASADRGEGFCVLADVSLIIKYLRHAGKIKSAMIVDFDAHQGNGYQRDFIGDDDIYIVNMYNYEIFPRDEAAKPAIDLKIEIPAYTSDPVYLEKARQALDTVFSEFKPDIVIYIAGMDVLDGDPLGALRVSETGIIERDEMVFRAVLDRRIPVVMLFGGGYQKANAPIIARSILNLKTQFGLWLE